MSNARLNEVEVIAHSLNSDAQRYRAECSEVLAILKQAVDAATGYRSQANAGNEVRERLEGKVSGLRGKLHSGETAMQTRMKGVEKYHDSVVSNKQALRAQSAVTSRIEGRLSKIR